MLLVPSFIPDHYYIYLRLVPVFLKGDNLSENALPTNISLEGIVIQKAALSDYVGLSVT